MWRKFVKVSERIREGSCPEMSVLAFGERSSASRPHPAQEWGYGGGGYVPFGYTAHKPLPSSAGSEAEKWTLNSRARRLIK